MIVTRQATVDDAGLWRALRLDGIMRYPSAFRMSLQDHDKSTLQQDAEQLAKGGRFLALQGTQAVGSTGLYHHKEAGLEHRGVLFGMYVTPVAQGTNAAADLMANAISYAQEIGVWQIELSVNEANTRAVSFYSREGFVQYGRLPNAVNGEDGLEHDLLMLRSLPHHS